MEETYRNRIISLLTPIVGPGNINAQVNLDIDFTRSEVTEEIVDPDGNALRSEQNTEDLTRVLNLQCSVLTSAHSHQDQQFPQLLQNG